MMNDQAKMEALARGESTISGKIRALDRAGVRRADIARFLNRRYQHVRNVLEAEKQRSARESEDDQALSVSHYQDTGQSHSSGPMPVGTVKHGGPAIPSICRLRTSEDGNLLIPASILKALGIGGGEVVIGTVEGEQVALTSATASMRRAQELMAKLLPGDDSLAESLIVDRRREVEQERLGG
jgi:bifunctional DNA-binding transcriptional regulator/antitoxin component of YhaV-PrlF toxin-antitoxin module